MNLEYVSVEDNKFRRRPYPPERNKSTPLLQKEAGAGSHRKVSSPEIVRVLQVLSDKRLCGLRHVERYLHDLYCRNCRPNTIRSNGGAIILFLEVCRKTPPKLAKYFCLFFENTKW